jgi:NadR type nicotinamide-nucleotide adenylyltransferase
MRVVVTGSECTGKTTLAEMLAAHYVTACVFEFARQFVAEKGAAPVYADVEAIARGQIETEDEATRNAKDGSRVLIQDTDLLSTIVYSEHYYHDCPGWITTAFEKRAAQLYVLTGIDVPWSPDGEQRDRGDRREEMHELFQKALVDRELRFIDVRGSSDDRLRAALTAIDNVVKDR